VDYKASGAKEGELYDSYKRQMEIYQWLLRQNGFKVLDRGYFVYCRVNKDDGFEDGQLSFNVKVQSYDGKADWVDGKLIEARRVLDSPIPEPSPECIYCKYFKSANNYL